MSTDNMEKDAKSELSKEERRRRREAKRAKKAAADSSSVPVQSNDVMAETKSERKEKKKRKREDDQSTPLPTTNRPNPDLEDKKEKKRTSSGLDIDPQPILSKKKLKKLATASAPATTPNPSTAPPEFEAIHDSYLSTHSITLQPRLYPPLLNIKELEIHPGIIRFLEKFEDPTPIQACSWPALLGGKDVVGIAETGSGKTLAFGVPGLNLLAGNENGKEGGKGKEGGIQGWKEGAKGKAKAGKIEMLVLAPTRELAQQSHETLIALGEGLGVGSVCLYGGVGKDDQLRELRKATVRVVVGTPGRTLDLADSGDLDLTK